MAIWVGRSESGCIYLAFADGLMLLFGRIGPRHPFCSAIVLDVAVSPYLLILSYSTNVFTSAIMCDSVLSMSGLQYFTDWKHSK